jgi:hypothetical protein
VLILKQDQADHDGRGRGAGQAAEHAVIEVLTGMLDVVAGQPHGGHGYIEGRG